MNGFQDVVGISVHCRGAVGAALGLRSVSQVSVPQLLAPPAELTVGVSVSASTETSPYPYLICLSIEKYLIDMYLYISAKFLPELQGICFVLCKWKGFSTEIYEVYFFLDFFHS